MIHYKSEAQIALMRESALLVGKTLALVASHIKPGVTTMELDKIAADFIKSNGATASFKGYNGYPYTCCISVNDAVVHGFPNNVPLKEGDVVSVDIGVFKNGYHGDSAYTFALAPVKAEVMKLLQVTKASLYKGIEKAVQGNRIGDIGFAIQDYTEKQHGYGVVRDLVGHGLGQNMHEEPQVPNYGKKGTREKMKEGMVLAIEPMINMGTKNIIHHEDGWTILTADGMPSAHFEHDVCVRKGKADILSSFEEVEAAERANPALDPVVISL